MSNNKIIPPEELSTALVNELLATEQASLMHSTYTNTSTLEGRAAREIIRLLKQLSKINKQSRNA